MAAPETALTTTPLQLVFDDGEPMESNWHVRQMLLLIDVISQAMVERGRTDYFCGGNMFIYYSVEQARAVATEPARRTRHYRGPDTFWVGGVEPRGDRGAWVVWDEGGRYPDLIVELLSPSTARIDRNTKKTIYERTFRTPDYFLYERQGAGVEGFHLVDGAYRPVPPDEHGRWRVESLDLWFGLWQGLKAGIDTRWLRLFDRSGRLIPTAEEAARGLADAEQRRADAEQRRADAERARADAERKRAEDAEAEVARLRAGDPGSRGPS